MQSPDFWKNYGQAGELSRELNNLKEKAKFWENIENRLESYSQLDESGLAAKEQEIREFGTGFNKEFMKLFLSGKYDHGKALLYIYSGAGGVDAQDWASMLLKMYQKYVLGHGWGFCVLDQSFGEQNGTKHAVAEVIGQYAYGYLKGETGVHRLIRISPFSAQKLRHTSFALVDVLPEIEDVKIELESKDLRIDTFRSSGPGGQNVNKLETAVRITHIPTKIVASVQSERSQAQNKEKATKLLKSRLAKMMEDKQVAELNQLRVETHGKEIEWGSQIRSYVLNPYKQVKDHRTGVESTQPEKVLDGEIKEFIEAELGAQ